MSRNTKTILEIVLAIAVMAIASLIVYYLGGILAKSFLDAESVKHSEWMKSYFGLVRGTGIAQFVCLLVWIALARFVLTVHDPFGAGKRAVWAVLFAVSAIISIAAPYIYHGMHSGFVPHMLIVIIFLVFYTLAGYWGGSLFLTPDAYKYTPIGGTAVRAPKVRK